MQERGLLFCLGWPVAGHVPDLQHKADTAGKRIRILDFDLDRTVATRIGSESKVLARFHRHSIAIGQTEKWAEDFHSSTTEFFGGRSERPCQNQ